MYPFIKRTSDIFASLLALVFLLPILITVTVLLLLTGERYVFFYQRRIGFQNRYFNIIKFATMLRDSPNMSLGSITVKNDPRVTPIGKFLRKTKLNELPQIFNVIKGDMSIVGPRPLVDQTFIAYPERIRPFIYSSKPGITGIGSIVFRDEEALISKAQLPPHEYYKNYIAPYKGELELWYNKRKSFSVDLQIIFLTAWVIIFPKSRLMYKIFTDLPLRGSTLNNFGEPGNITNKQ